MIPQVGDQLAGYRLDALVGRGGGGVVYRATHLRLDRPVALKLLTADLAADESFRRRFEREARLAAALEHPHIVPVYDAGEADGLLYLAMRFIEGLDLATLIATHGPLSLERTCAILGQVADALDVAHGAGLVHRDVKPANILVGAADATGRDRVYLSDFGLTRRAEGTSLTGNMVAGTLTYMAPERFRAGTAPEPAADVYALACTAYTCLSGSPPFTGGSFEEILAAHLYADPPRLSAADPSLPSAVDAVLARALAKDPAQRHPSCGAMVEGLRAASRLTEPTRDLSQRVPMAAAPGPFAAPMAGPVQGPAGPPLAPPAGPGGPAPTPARRPRRGRLIVAVVGIVAVAAAVTVAVVTRGGGGAGPTAPAAAVATATRLAASINALTLDGEGNLYIAALGDDSVQKVTPAGVISTVAGGAGEGFSGDGGPATQARLRSPQGLAVDPAGNLYIADTGNQRVRKVDPAGIITTIAGNGSQTSSGDGGPATQAQFRYPVDVALDGAGGIYVAEAEGARIRRIDRTGMITTVAGNGIQAYGGDGGPATEAGFVFALSIAVDGAGSIYIGDNSDNRVRKVDPTGTMTTVAGTGEAGSLGDGGPATAAQVEPGSLAVDPAGNLYITDGDRVREVDTAGTIRTVAGTGDRGASGDGGPATQAELAVPDAIAVAPGGVFYVGDDYNHRVRRVDAAGIITTVAGKGPDYPGDGGKATDAYLSLPTFTVIDAAGRIYLTDTGDHRIRRVDPDGTITTVAGNGTKGFSGDGGPATSAQLNNPLGIALDKAGDLYIADTDNERIRKVAADGTITTVAGTGRRQYSADGLQATASDLSDPIAVEVAPDGGVLFADAASSRVRRLDPSGTISTIAGTGDPGFAGDGGPATAAQLNWPYALHLTADGTLFVSDNNNNAIRRIAPDGTITTVAGTGAAGFSGDGGPATAATLDGPEALVTDAAGNLFFSDTGNRRLRRIDPNGVITTAAGTGTSGQGADGPALTVPLDSPGGLAVPASGGVYVVEGTYDRVYLLDPTAGTLTRTAGVPY